MIHYKYKYEYNVYNYINFIYIIISIIIPWLMGPIQVFTNKFHLGTDGLEN